MSESLPLAFALVFLTASYIVVANPVWATSLSENTWIIKAPLPEAIAGCKSTVVDGKIYVMGVAHNYEYDPMLNVWTARSPMPTPRSDFGLAVYEHKIFAIGGLYENKFSSANEVYDTLNDTWETMSSMPTARSGIGANTVNGEIYVTGGDNYTGGYVGFLNALPTNEVYNISNNSWTTRQPMPYPVYSYACAVLGDKIYFMGGTNRTIPSKLTQIYYTQNDTWSFGADLPTAVLGAAASATGSMAPERIYVVGGVPYVVIDVQALSDNQVYDPKTNTWSLAAAMPTARDYLTMANLNDNLFAIGGSPDLSGSFLTTNEMYAPLGYGTPDPLYLPTPTASTSQTSSSSTATPAVPEFPALAILFFFLSLLSVAVVLKHRKHHQNTSF